MSDEPRKRTATEAMRLKPATQPRPAPACRAVHPERPVSCTSAAGHPGPHFGDDGTQWVEVAELPAGAVLELHLSLREALLEMHRPAEIGVPTYCIECLLPHPCNTRRLATGEPAAPTPREDASQ